MKTELIVAGFIVFLAMIAFFALLGTIGFVHMCKHNCHLKKPRCNCCADLEKEDLNEDYGEYYYSDGERRLDVMEVGIL